MQSNYRSQKGMIAQNIMAAVNFNFEFVFVLAGGEGSAHDTRVFTNATSKSLNIPGNKYFLADAGYGLRKGLMTPYQAVWYHLKEQAAAGLRPETKKELYKLCHTTQRNCVERIFGCIKKKFSILQPAPEIDLSKQVRLIYALCMLWNFMRKHELVKTIFQDYAEEDHLNFQASNNNNNKKPPPTTAQEDTYMKFCRD
jgi:hypothetical protein